jgi:hypothetical protein
MPDDPIDPPYTGDDEEPRAERRPWGVLVWIALFVALLILFIVLHGTGLMRGLHGGTHGG